MGMKCGICKREVNKLVGLVAIPIEYKKKKDTHSFTGCEECYVSYWMQYIKNGKSNKTKV